MRIVFIGGVEFSYRALERLIALGANIIGVCTQRAAGINADYADLCALCAEHKIICRKYGAEDSEEMLRWISELVPDIIFCLGWSRLLKPELLALPPRGVVGFHPAALPRNRGRHPLIWALVLGLEQTASSFFFMKEEADNGDIISQRTINIATDDDAASLYAKMTETALAQLDDLLPQLEAGTVARNRQNNGVANTWRKRTLADGEIDWRMSARAIHNLVRGLTRPYVGAHFMLSGTPIKVWRSKVIDGTEANIEPGKVVSLDGSFCAVKCGDGLLVLLETEPSIKLTAGSYL